MSLSRLQSSVLVKARPLLGKSQWVKCLSSVTLPRRNEYNWSISNNHITRAQTLCLFNIPNRIFFSTDSKEKEKGQVSEKDSQENKSQGKLAQLWRRYGYLSIATYLGIYGATLTSMFLALEYDIFNAATFGFDAGTLIAGV